MSIFFNKNIKYLSLKLISIIFLIFSFSSCLSFKPSTTKSKKKYFETFYVGDDGTQYFIKPFQFFNLKTKEHLLVDITFRHKNHLKDSATLNISFLSSELIKSIDSLIISNSKNSIKSNQLKLLYNEKNKSGFISRYSVKFSLIEIKELFSENNWKIISYNLNSTDTYQAEKKTLKIINTIRENIFVLM